MEQRASNIHISLALRVAAVVLGISQATSALAQSAADLDHLVAALAANSSEEQILRLLQQGGDPDARDPNGVPAIVAAAFAGNLPVVQVLADSGADIETTDQYSSTPLMAALAAGKRDVAEFLIKRGADVNHTRTEGYSPLMVAAQNDRANDLVQMLLGAGARINQVDEATGETPFLRGAVSGDAAIVRTLAKWGADVNAVTREGRNAIMCAIEMNVEDVGFIKTLLDLGVKAQYESSYGWTPLMSAIAGNSNDAVGLLLQSGASSQHVEQALLVLGIDEQNMTLINAAIALGANPLLNDEYGNRIIDAAINNPPVYDRLRQVSGFDVPATERE